MEKDELKTSVNENIIGKIELSPTVKQRTTKFNFPVEKNEKITVKQRTTKFMNLHHYCLFAGRDDFIEVTEWVNGEGVDVDLHSKHSGDTKFSLTYGEWDCLQMIMEYDENV